MCDLLAGHDVAGIRTDSGRSPDHNGTARFSTKAVVLPMARRVAAVRAAFRPLGKLDGVVLRLGDCRRRHRRGLHQHGRRDVAWRLSAADGRFPWLVAHGDFHGLDPRLSLDGCRRVLCGAGYTTDMARAWSCCLADSCRALASSWRARRKVFPYFWLFTAPPPGLPPAQYMSR